MTDTRSPRNTDEDQRELLAELDELFPDSSSDERHLGHSTDGAIAFGQDADDIPADELGELEALFDTFYEDGEESSDKGSEASDPGSDVPADDQSRDKSAAAPHSTAERQEGTVAKGDGPQENPLDALSGIDVAGPATQPPFDSVKGTGPSEELNDPGGNNSGMPASNGEAGGVAQNPPADAAKVTGLIEAGINLKDNAPEAVAGTGGVVPPAQETAVDAAKEAGASEGGLDIDEKENGSGAQAGGDVDPAEHTSSVETLNEVEVPGASGGEEAVTENAAGSAEMELQEGVPGTGNGNGEAGPAGEAADAPLLEDAGGAGAQNGSVAPAAGTEATVKAEYPRVSGLESNGAGDSVALPGDSSGEPLRPETDAASAVPAGAQDEAVTSPPEEAEDSDGERFPFVQPGTVVDVRPPRTSLALTAESVPVREAGVTGKIALAAGALGLLIAGGAGWLAWKAQEEVAAMHERIGSLQPAAPPADQDPKSGAFGNRLADLTRRVDALAATDGAGDREEIAAVRSELKLLSERFGGLDARLDALGAKLGSGSSAAAAQEARTEPARPGRWAVNLASFADQATARGELKRIRRLGIDAEVTSASAGGRTWYRIRVPGFASASEAKKFVSNEAAPAGFEEAWVGPQ